MDSPPPRAPQKCIRSTLQAMVGRPGRPDCQTGAERQAAAGPHEWVGEMHPPTTVSRPCSEGEPALSLALGVTIQAGGQ
ncbi:hypothetical protein BDBG_16533 [Blastomyces gilchristii SLH14081]|uniref:Uncharacterized protein n=1 Tax=Blastomyces gilchristii (strain SLH14081) TaxID=559298 RepID=A0A179UDC9_BLAGS|nr:uncharacterized protein BDBG_16533 [Blastomyces gilchristii SLH14081]OAT05974.1 hypothetical protein BDBG_16533 [Blastomyces gilchristii SLH14081]